MMRGKGNLVLTGQLGDVMKESAQAALSYVRSRATDLNIDENFLENNDLHVHIPAGGIPKDGPSAGITLFVALVSLLTDKPVRPDVALSGEITLRGTVLPVGGVKEKVLAAHRAGIKTVVLPERNRKDMDDIPDQAKEEMAFHFASRIDEALWLVQGGTPPPAYVQPPAE
jgi:ATP-dependent Lon protease